MKSPPASLADVGSSAGVAAAKPLGLNAPLSERILSRLGSPRWLWIGAWASTSIAAPIVLLAFLAAQDESAPRAALPILVTSTSNVATVALSLTVIGIVVVVFFLSMWRLHVQMAEAKAHYVADTRTLLAAAYTPLRAGLSVDALASQATALGAAQSLADRAERILQWPVDEGMTAWVAIIVTGVVTSLIVRLIFAAVGLG